MDGRKAASFLELLSVGKHSLAPNLHVLQSEILLVCSQPRSPGHISLLHERVYSFMDLLFEPNKILIYTSGRLEMNTISGQGWLTKTVKP